MRALFWPPPGTLRHLQLGAQEIHKDSFLGSLRTLPAGSEGVNLRAGAQPGRRATAKLLRETGEAQAPVWMAELRRQAQKWGPQEHHQDKKCSPRCRGRNMATLPGHPGQVLAHRCL